jgi:hypothetical protein
MKDSGKTTRKGGDMKTIVAGLRTVTDPDLMADAINASRFDISEVVNGGAPGVGTLAEEWAE